MEQLLIIMLMIIIGALIGGFTNFLAICMLFRPHRTIYIGRWRVPFTPGLIPKRKEELAEQLGHLVSNHLVTKEAVAGKLFDPHFKREVHLRLQKAIERWLAQKPTLGQLVEGACGKNEWAEVIHYIKERLNQAGQAGLHQLGAYSIAQILPPSLLNKLEGELIPTISNHLLKGLAGFLNSSDGGHLLGELLERFLNQRQGWLRLFSPLLFREERLVQMIQQELVPLISHPLAVETMASLLKREWERLKNRPVETWLKSVGEESVQQVVRQLADRAVSPLFQQPIDEWLGEKGKEMVDQGLKAGLDHVEEWLKPRIGTMLDRLDLAHLVAERVKGFPVERVEALVLAIARRELYMITYLGAILGGTIGFVQGLIALILG